MRENWLNVCVNATLRVCLVERRVWANFYDSAESALKCLEWHYHALSSSLQMLVQLHLYILVSSGDGLQQSCQCAFKGSAGVLSLREDFVC